MNDRSQQLKEQILLTLAQLPTGFATSYGDVARRAGLPGYHRLVARVLRELPEGSQIAWYRVMTASRQPAFAVGSSDFKRQQEQLASEGVLLEGGRVGHHQWLPTAESAPANTRSISRNKASKPARSRSTSR